MRGAGQNAARLFHKRQDDVQEQVGVGRAVPATVLRVDIERVLACAISARVVDADDDQGQHRLVGDEPGQRFVHLPLAAVGAGRPVKTVLPVLQVQHRETRLRGRVVIAGRQPDADRARSVRSRSRHLHDPQRADHGVRLRGLAGPPLHRRGDRRGGGADRQLPIRAVAAVGRFFHGIPTAASKLVIEGLPGIERQVTGVSAISRPRQLDPIGFPAPDAGQRTRHEDRGAGGRVRRHVDDDGEAHGRRVRGWGSLQSTLVMNRLFGSST